MWLAFEGSYHGPPIKEKYVSKDAAPTTRMIPESTTRGIWTAQLGSGVERGQSLPCLIDQVGAIEEQA